MATRKTVNARKFMGETKFTQGYARHLEEKNRHENWIEATNRAVNMHEKKYELKMSERLSELIEKARTAYHSQLVLGAQRALQFGGEHLFKHEAKMYNCSSTYVDRPAVFAETLYLLLCGCGVGFSVQNRHIDKLPEIQGTDKSQPAVIYTIEDSIEGWSDAVGVLMSSYFVAGQQFPEYAGRVIHFDFSKIRPAGAAIANTFIAPGPDALRSGLIRIQELLDKEIEAGAKRLRSIVVYDILMHIADLVISGGVRRSATICLFDKTDKDMLEAKTGDWYIKNPQRGRSNNSVILKRDELTREEWAEIMQRVKTYGEPGFVFVDDLDITVNPCVEIGMYPQTKSGESGFQFCNLTEINGGQCDTKEKFFEACEAAAILGTLQAGYTSFKYLSPASKEITEAEALLGVSVTGWMNNPKVLFNEATLKEGAEIVKRVNREVAALIGIRPAARATCVKPSGNASVLLGTASGIGGEHSEKYIRHVQLHQNDPVLKAIREAMPQIVEPLPYGDGTSVAVAFPISSPEGSIYKSDLMGVKQLDYVKMAQQWWVDAGTNIELCQLPSLRHNVSNTISVDNWDEVEEYIFQNREHFAGISLLAAAGDRAYNQAPFTEVRSAEEILEDYGNASMFASGLIVDGMHAFNNNLWLACDKALYSPDAFTEDSHDLLMKDWVRRLFQFANKYFDGENLKAVACLKDVYILHKYERIVQNFKEIDLAAIGAPKFVEVNTLGAQGCSGGACEVSF